MQSKFISGYESYMTDSLRQMICCKERYIKALEGQIELQKDMLEYCQPGYIEAMTLLRLKKDPEEYRVDMWTFSRIIIKIQSLEVEKAGITLDIVKALYLKASRELNITEDKIEKLTKGSVEEEPIKAIETQKVQAGLLKIENIKLQDKLVQAEGHLRSVKEILKLCKSNNVANLFMMDTYHQPLN